MVTFHHRSATAPPRMPLRVLFVSQRRAEGMRPPRGCALISITDRDRPPASLRPGWHAVLRLAFDDADPRSLPNVDIGLRPFDATHAARVADFVRTHLAQGTRIVVHCRHGISRSAGIAKAIAEAGGAPFPADYNEYNRHVHGLVRKAFAAMDTLVLPQCRAMLALPAAQTGAREMLLAVLRASIELVALGANDFAWSSWPDAGAAVAQLRGHVDAIEQGAPPDLAALDAIFAVTGPMQDLALHSGWGQLFLLMAHRFDDVAARLRR